MPRHARNVLRSLAPHNPPRPPRPSRFPKQNQEDRSPALVAASVPGVVREVKVVSYAASVAEGAVGDAKAPSGALPSRASLQALAKAYNVPANLKSAEIVSRLALLGVKPSTVVVTPLSTAADLQSASSLASSSHDPSTDWIPPRRFPGSAPSDTKGGKDAEPVHDGTRPVTSKPEWTGSSIERQGKQDFYKVIPKQPITVAEVKSAMTLMGASDFACFSFTDVAPMGVVLVTGRSRQHLLGMANALVSALAERGLKPFNPSQPIEGLDHDGWMLVDTGDMIVNLFTESERKRVNLEERMGENGRSEIRV